MYEPLRRKPDREHSDWKGAHGATQRALKARKGQATEADRPPPSTFPGRKATVIDGQLSLNDREGEALRWETVTVKRDGGTSAIAQGRR